MRNYCTHLEAAIDGTRLSAEVAHTLHNGRPIWVRYDLDALRRDFPREALRDREPTMWRYRELLPVRNPVNIVSLGETMTPLLACPRLGRELGLPHLTIKDESRLPTGSFKARGQAVAISKCKEFGVKRVAIPTAGNAGGAMAAYAARAGMEAYVFMPSDTPEINIFEAALAGAKVFKVDGLINDCGRIVRDGAEAMGWFDLSTLKEPYRIEGKKTMGLELAEQMKWTLPDVILYPTGGGTGLIGMWKAFAEMIALGWLPADVKLPRMVSVQSAGCAPIARAFDQGHRHAPVFENAATVASGLRVPVAVGDFMILDAVRESGGTAIAVDEDQILDWMQTAVAAEGISVCPESAACIVAAYDLKRSGFLKASDQVLIFNCGAAQKYPHVLPLDLPTLSPSAPINWSSLAEASSAVADAIPA